MLLAANAGSGKTAVLAERFARAVVEDGILPRELLAITFTDKAAGELRHRIRGRLLGARCAGRGALDGPGLDLDDPRLLHASAARPRGGGGPGPGVRGDRRGDGARAAPGRVRRSTRGGARPGGRVDHDGGRDVGGGPPPGRGARRPRRPAQSRCSGTRSCRRLQPRGDVPSACAGVGTAAAAFRDELVGAKQTATVTAMRDALATCDDLLADGASLHAGTLKSLRVARRGNDMNTAVADDFYAALDALDAALIDREALAHHALLAELLADYGRRYEAAKAARSGVDYDDLELAARDLLRDHASIAEEIAGRFRRVMVDEFQDTNPRQLQLLELLGHEDLFVVGDALQSIYGFRHADVAVFRRAQALHRTRGSAARAADELAHRSRDPEDAGHGARPRTRGLQRVRRRAYGRSRARAARHHDAAGGRDTRGVRRRGSGGDRGSRRTAGRPAVGDRRCDGARGAGDRAVGPGRRRRRRSPARRTSCS